MKRVIKLADRKMVMNEPYIFHLSQHLCTKCSQYELKGLLEYTLLDLV